MEESFSNPEVKLGGKLAFWEEVDGLPRVANRNAARTKIQNSTSRSNETEGEANAVDGRTD
jgi:hypothetical protein